jgi:hypothetical protein
LNELGIEWIAAHSPQAKGRIEGAPLAVVAAPGITLMCSRAPDCIFVYTHKLGTQMVFSTVKGNAHEVTKLEAGTAVMNSGLSPDGKLLVFVKAGENRIRLLCPPHLGQWQASLELAVVTSGLDSVWSVCSILAHAICICADMEPAAGNGREG